MTVVIVGALSLLVAYFFDWASLRRFPLVKPAIVVIVLGLQGYALCAACFWASKFGLPAALSWLGWVLLPISLLLLASSFIIEIPRGETYARAGVGQKLVTTGTYALVRHPGVLWYILFLISLLLISRSTIFLVALPVWAGLDILHVAIEEWFFLPRMFSQYNDYQRQTPLLIPSRASIATCLRTLKGSVAK